jgi:hypothetical protein
MPMSTTSSSEFKLSGRLRVTRRTPSDNVTASPVLTTRVSFDGLSAPTLRWQSKLQRREPASARPVTRDLVAHMNELVVGRGADPHALGPPARTRPPAPYWCAGRHAAVAEMLRPA